MVASLVEALVRLLDGEVMLSCLFLFIIAMERLSSESSLGIWIMGLDDSAKLWGGVNAVEGSIGLGVAGGGISREPKMLLGCCAEGFSTC